MDSNINGNYIREYSRKLADKLIPGFFAKKSTISGSEVVRFSDITQINYFILHSLFESWHHEFNKLKSPYFNYDAEEVKDASAKFMNVLSRHILIEKGNFKTLLEEAVAKTLLLLFSPYDFFIKQIRTAPQGVVSTAVLRDLVKYIKINSHLLHAYIDALEQRNAKELPANVAEDVFNEVCEQFKESPDEFESFLEQFNALVPLAVDDIYEHSEAKSAEKPASPPAEKEVTAKTQQILLDTFEVEKKEALVEIHEKKPLAGIKKSISINQRFMFEKELFGDNKEEFERVVTTLDAMTSRQEALGFISENYLKTSWDADKEEVIEFLTILNKRFPE